MINGTTASSSRMLSASSSKARHSPRITGCSWPLPGWAWERFTDEGPLALLPHQDHGVTGYALVWCCAPEQAQRRLALPDDLFADELGRAFGTRMGRFTLVGKRHAFPLGLNAAPVTVQHRVVAVGNAAQTLHPVAGQGLNLGLRDAAVLARELARGTGLEAIANFMTARAQDRKLTIGLTDAMARAFVGGGPLQPLLGLGLATLDLVKPARLLLADLMMFGRR